MTDRRTKEAVRYLGYGRTEADGAVLDLIRSSFAELDGCVRARSVHRIFDVAALGENHLQVGPMQIHSHSLCRSLGGCGEAVLFAATLGAEADALLRRYSLTDMARTVVLQACAAACLEEYCDACQDALARELAGREKYLRPRFSPGYGDFDIRHQEELLRILDTAKRIGLTMTDSCMLTPTKSVTALIGISASRDGCPLQGCEACEKRDCPYRRS